MLAFVVAIVQGFAIPQLQSNGTDHFNHNIVSPIGGSNTEGLGLLWLALDSASKQVVLTPCCTTCSLPRVKFFSVDVPHGFCGETCIRPSVFPFFKKFEPNLTLYNGTNASPCAEQFTPWGTHYTIYNGTVTHGVWPLTDTLDLYAPEPPI